MIECFADEFGYNSFGDRVLARHVASPEYFPLWPIELTKGLGHQRLYDYVDGQVLVERQVKLCQPSRKKRCQEAFIDAGRQCNRKELLLLITFYVE